LWPVLG